MDNYFDYTYNYPHNASEHSNHIIEYDIPRNGDVVLWIDVGNAVGANVSLTVMSSVVSYTKITHTQQRIPWSINLLAIPSPHIVRLTLENKEQTLPNIHITYRMYNNRKQRIRLCCIKRWTHPLWWSIDGFNILNPTYEIELDGEDGDSQTITSNIDEPLSMREHIPS